MQVRRRENHTIKPFQLPPAALQVKALQVEAGTIHPPITQQQSLSPTETDALYQGKGILTYQGEGMRGNMEKRVRDANEKLQEQAAMHHERFVTTSRNSMAAQYMENPRH